MRQDFPNSVLTQEADKALHGACKPGQKAVFMPLERVVHCVKKQYNIVVHMAVRSVTGRPGVSVS